MVRLVLILPYAFVDSCRAVLAFVALGCVVLLPSDDLEVHLDVVEFLQDMVNDSELNSSSSC